MYLFLLLHRCVLHLFNEALSRLEARLIVSANFHRCLLQDVSGCLSCTMFYYEASKSTQVHILLV